MLKLTLLCTLFLVCSQNETTDISNSRLKRQVPQTKSTSNNSNTAPGTVIRRTNVPTHEACEKLCREEKMIKCLFIKYISEKKMCYLTDKETTNKAVTEATAKPPDSGEKQSLKLQEISRLLAMFGKSSTNKEPSTKKQVVTQISTKKGASVIKQAGKVIPKSKEPSEITIKKQQKKKKTNSVPKPNPLEKPVLELKADIEDAKKKGQLNSNEMKEKMKNLEEYLNKVRELKQMINALGSTIAGNFTRLREVQIRSLLHFNKRLHNIYRDLMRTRQDMDKMTAMMKGLKGNDTANKEYIRDSIADLKRTKARFVAAIRSLQQRIAKLHLDMASFHQLIHVIMSNLNSLKRQQVSRLEMQRFQELSLRSLAHLHHHDRRVWRRIKRLEQNIRLVAHAVVLSQIEESKSRVLIKKINEELQALKGAVKNSYIWHNVQLLGGFHGNEYNLTTDKDHMHKTLITYIRELNEANIERYRKMSQRVNKFLLKTLQGVSKIEKRRKWLARNRIERMKQVLKSSLMSLSVWTGRVKEVVKSLDERIDSLTQKTQKLSEGNKLAKLDSHHLKEKMDEVNKKEENLAGSLKNLEEKNIKNAVQLQKDLHNELKKTIDRQSNKLQRKTEKKIQNAITSAQKVDKKLEKMKQIEAKKLKETKEKIENKVKAAVKKVSKNVARDKLLAAQNAKEMQLQKKKIREALKKLTALGNVQFLKLKENVEAIMNEKTGNVDKALTRKLSKIKDAVRKTLHSVSTAKKKDHKQLTKLKTQFGEFLIGVKDIEEQRKVEGKKNAKEAERKRKEEVSRVLAATTRKVEKMQQRMNKENQRKIGKLEKKALKKLSKNDAKDQILAAQNAELQRQKKKIREALKKLTALGNVQFSKLKANIEAIMNEKSGDVEKVLTGKFSKIKDAVRKTLNSVSLTKKKDHKQIKKLRMQFGEFLNGVKDLEAQRQKADIKIAQKAERNRNKKVSKVLAATTRRIEELQQRMNEKNQRKLDKLKKELETAESEIKKEISAQKRKEKKKIKENRLIQKKMDELKQKIIERNRAMKQKEKEANKKVQQIANQLSKVEAQKARTKLENQRKEQEKAKLKERINKIKKKTKEMAIIANKRKEDLKKKLEKTKIEMKAKIAEKSRKDKMKMKQIQEKQRKEKEKLEAFKQKIQKKNELAQHQEREAIKKIQQLENRLSRLSAQKASSRSEYQKNEEQKAKLIAQITRMKKKTKKFKDLANKRNKKLQKKIKKVETNMKKITKIKNELIKKEEKMKQAETRAKEKIRRIIASLKGSKQKVSKEQREKYKTRHRMKVMPKTGKHGKIPENAAKIPFPKKGTKEERKAQTTRHKKIEVMPKTEKLSKNAAKISFFKRKEILKQLEENRKKYKIAKQKLLETKKKIQNKRKEEKDLALLPAKSDKDKKLINKRKKKIDRKIKKYLRICRVSGKEMRRRRERLRKLQRKNRYDWVFSKNVKVKEKGRKYHRKHRIMKILPKIEGQRHATGGAAKISFSKRKEISEMLKENREKYNKAKQRILETKKKIQSKLKEKKELMLLPTKTKQEKKSINKLNRKLKKLVLICRISRKEMKRRQERRRRLQEKYRRERVQKQGTRNRKHRVMKIVSGAGREKYAFRSGFKISFSKTKATVKELEENKKKYSRTKQKIFETKKKLREKLKEKKELSLLPAKTLKDKKIIQNRKDNLKRKIKKYRRICVISQKMLERMRERRKRLQEKIRREEVREQGRRKRKHHALKIIPGSGRERYVSRGVVKISFSKRKELSEKLKDNKKKYKQAKQKLLKTKKKLRAKIKEKKELSLLPAKTLKEKKLIQKRKEKLKQKIKKYRRICRISVKELKRKREGRRRLQEKYRREKVITKRRRYPKHHTMKLIPGDGRKIYVPRGGVKIYFAKKKEILKKLKDNKKKYKQAKQKILETKKKLRAKIKEKKELSLLPAKTLKEKKLIQKRKDKLQQKIKKYRRICIVSVKELKRRRERKRRLQEKYLVQKRKRIQDKHSRKKPKQNKRKSMKIVPSNRKTRKLTKGTMKIMFKRRNPK